MNNGQHPQNTGKNEACERVLLGALGLTIAAVGSFHQHCFNLENVLHPF
jgi:hypothetical protein